MSKVHELKTINPYFDQVASGKKKFELRKNDRDFEVDDILILRHYIPKTNICGLDIVVRITGILQNFPGLEDGYCILSISEPI